MDAGEHPVALEQVQRAVDGGAADPFRVQLVRERLGVDDAGLRDQCLDHDRARAGHALARVGKPLEEPVSA